MSQQELDFTDFSNDFAEIYERCAANAPNYGVSKEDLQNALQKAALKYLAPSAETPPAHQQIRQFFSELQINDLFIALACAGGSERAWWDFDAQYRPYIERVARHLASADTDAEEVIDAVYVELYGTRIVDGARQSKFATYSGRGTLKGWLRIVVWHSLVDLHRTGHDEVSLDEMMESVGEGYTHSMLKTQQKGGEDEMLETITRERYRSVTVRSLEKAFQELADFEKLLLLYYHVEGLKMREIARLVETPESPLRGWFQRKSPQREKSPQTRVHESTVMRWLEKVYGKISKTFRRELSETHKISEKEIKICLELVLQDMSAKGFTHILNQK